MSAVTVATGDSDWPAAWPEALAAKSLSAASVPKLEGGSPSVRFVYATIRHESKVTTKEIQRRTGLPERTVRHAVRWLADRGLLNRYQVLGDARRTQIHVGPLPTARPAPPMFAC